MTPTVDPPRTLQGPGSRTRSERLYSTILGDDEGAIRCPRVWRLGLAFGDRPPLAVAQAWLDALGFADETAARAHIDLPDRSYLCQRDPNPNPRDAATIAPAEGLRIALMLGLCSSTHYSPDRPLLWTTMSLTRQLFLYEPEGFYA
jgi:hypothetical protein